MYLVQILTTLLLWRCSPFLLFLLNLDPLWMAHLLFATLTTSLLHLLLVYYCSLDLQQLLLPLISFLVLPLCSTLRWIWKRWIVLVWWVASRWATSWWRRTWPRRWSRAWFWSWWRPILPAAAASTAAASPSFIACLFSIKLRCINILLLLFSCVAHDNILFGTLFSHSLLASHILLGWRLMGGCFLENGLDWGIFGTRVMFGLGTCIGGGMVMVWTRLLLDCCCRWQISFVLADHAFEWLWHN